jgi:hypothetical protein
VIYTTNAIEMLNYRLREVTRNRSILASDEAIYKIKYVALRNAAKKWAMPIKGWGAALNQFSLFFGGRVPLLHQNYPFLSSNFLYNIYTMIIISMTSHWFYLFNTISKILYLQIFLYYII